MAASKKTGLEKQIELAEKDFERAHEAPRRAEDVWLAWTDRIGGTFGPETESLRHAIRDYRQKLNALVTLDEQKTEEKAAGTA